MPTLSPPAVAYKTSFLEAVRELQADGSGLGDSLKWNVDEIAADFDAFVASLRRFEPPARLPEGFVHSETRWLVEDDTYLGRVSIRHTLNDRLHEFGGHIGYEIRPSARRRGYGRQILALALDRARELGLTRVLLTCDVDNFTSRRVIEANGGVREGEFRLDFHEKPIRRYWIELELGRHRNLL